MSLFPISEPQNPLIDETCVVVQERRATDLKLQHWERVRRATFKRLIIIIDMRKRGVRFLWFCYSKRFEYQEKKCEVSRSAQLKKGRFGASKCGN